MPKYPCIFHSQTTVDCYPSLRHIPSAVVDCVCASLLSRVRVANGSASLLEAGCGTGRFLRPLAQMAATAIENHVVVEGCDISEGMLRELNKQPVEGKAIPAFQYDLAMAHVPDRRYDLVFTVATMHIIFKWRRALDNMVAMVKPGGYLVMIKEINQFMHRTEGFHKTADLDNVDTDLDEFLMFYHDLRRRRNEPYVASGIRYSDIAPALTHLCGRGLCLVEERLKDPGLTWQKPHTYGELLETFRLRTITTWGSDLSERARLAIHEGLRAWVASRGIDEKRVFELPARLQTFTFQKGGGESSAEGRR